MTPINRGEKFKCVILPHRQCPEKWLRPSYIQSWLPKYSGEPRAGRLPHRL